VIGTSASFFDIAKPMAERGVPQIRLRVREKRALDAGWPDMATTDVEKLSALSVQSPLSNSASVAQAKLGGFWFLEVDSKDVVPRIETETGQKMPDTFRVRSRPGRGHFYWKQTPASIAMGNISQSYVKGQDWSARVDNQYVVSANSIHPDSGEPYVALRDEPIVEAPDWLINWLMSQKVEKKASAVEDVPRNEAGLVPHGSLHGYLLHHAGKLRAMGLGQSNIESSLLELVHANGQPPIDDTKVRQMAKSICANYAAGTDKTLAMTQAPAVPTLPQTAEIDTTEAAVRPTFPEWVMHGTSLYTGLIEPALQTSSKHGEFIMMPSVLMMLNYLSGRVRVGFHKNLNIFVGLISPYGQFFKSSSCTLAQQYFESMGLCLEYSKSMKAAGEQTVVMQAGSPEGFGSVMNGINGQHAVLFNDELGKFVSKAGIDSSAFSSDLLTWYGAANFSNNTKAAKDRFNFPAGTYTFSWLWATTDRGFNRHWPKLAGISSGLEDRMFYVVSPEKPKPTTPYRDPIIGPGALRTRQLIDQAVAQQSFDFEDFEGYAQTVSGMDARSMDLVLKLAFYFTVDLGRKMIDADAIERAVALVQYRNQAAKFLAPIEADNPQGRLQKEIIRELQQHRGKMTYRELCRNLDYTRYGLDVWQRAYRTMLTEGIIGEFPEATTPGKRPAKMVGLLKMDD
jgi:hypothetical protein